MSIASPPTTLVAALLPEPFASPTTLAMLGLLVLLIAFRLWLGRRQAAQQRKGRDCIAQLAREKDILATVMDTSPDLITLQDTDLVYRAANRAFCRFFNVEAGEVVGSTDEALFSPAQARANREEDAEILETGIPLSKEIMVKREQAIRWFRITKTPVYHHDEIIGLLLFATDISTLKRYQDQLVQSQKMEDLGRLAGGVAHEINTPLSVILGHAQMLRDDLAEANPDLANDASIIERQAKVCRAIVSDLLKFARGGSGANWGTGDAPMAEVDLNANIRDVVDILEPIFATERVRIEADLDPRLPPVTGDADKLKSVWMNLLNNGFDAIRGCASTLYTGTCTDGTEPVAGTLTVKTKPCKHRRRVVIIIADTGSGISQENLQKIFEPFFTTKAVGEGTGLGLAVTLGIIHDHKGRITAESPAPVEYLGAVDGGQPGPGTAFRIELPLTDEGLPDDECEEFASAATATQTDSSTLGD